MVAIEDITISKISIKKRKEQKDKNPLLFSKRHKNPSSI